MCGVESTFTLYRIDTADGMEDNAATAIYSGTSSNFVTTSVMPCTAYQEADGSATVVLAIQGCANGNRNGFVITDADSRALADTDGVTTFTPPTTCSRNLSSSDVVVPRALPGGVTPTPDPTTAEPSE